MRSSEPILSGPYDPATQEARLNAARGIASTDGGAADDRDSDLLGVVESAAGALLDGGDDSDESDDAGGDDGGVSDDDAFSTDSGGDSTPLGDAQAFNYQPDMPDGDAEELAATTNNPRYAAKMLGYDQNTFSDMLHVFKPANGLGPADNVIFHDDGSVEFNGQMLDDNIHNYAP